MMRKTQLKILLATVMTLSCSMTQAPRRWWCCGADAADVLERGAVVISQTLTDFLLNPEMSLADAAGALARHLVAATVLTRGVPGTPMSLEQIDREMTAILIYAGIRPDSLKGQAKATSDALIASNFDKINGLLEQYAATAKTTAPESIAALVAGLTLFSTAETSGNLQKTLSGFLLEEFADDKTPAAVKASEPVTAASATVSSAVSAV